VGEDGGEGREVAGAEVFEVEGGDESAADIALALDAEDALLEFLQAAGLESESPEAAGGEEQINVLEAGEGFGMRARR
jgi:hypothetical protein